MIGKISGRLDMRGQDHVLIDTGGVGYVVYCSDRTLVAMPGIGERVAVFTDLVVREDLLQLYGFLTIAEREWHKLLTSVQGVGAKAALAIQGTLGPEGVSRAIALGDMAAVKAAPGVGPKLAQRVVNELKDKAPAIMALGASGSQASMVASSSKDEVADVIDEAPMPVTQQQSGSAEATAAALSALINLGYGQGEAAGAVAEIAQIEPNLDESSLIRAALRLLAPKG